MSLFRSSAIITSDDNKDGSYVEPDPQMSLTHESCNDHGNSVYRLSVDSIEDYSNETEFGQELIARLLRRGDIQVKSNHENPSDRLIRRDESNKNSRYDELVAAFNVIVEEILRQGKLTSYQTEVDESNCNQIDNEKREIVHRSNGCACNKCAGNAVDPMKRCLNLAEDHLLESIKSLNTQLSNFMRKKLPKFKRSVQETDLNSWVSKQTHSPHRNVRSALNQIVDVERGKQRINY